MQGKLDLAAESYRRALELAPNCHEAHTKLGLLLKNQGKWDEAIAHHNLGVALCMRGRPGEAIACYRRTIELMPNRADVHFNLGVALEGQGRVEEAIACYERTRELEPDYGPAHDALRRTRGWS